MSFIVQKQVLAKHYADLCFKLEWAIDACPETLWNSDCLNPRYWYLAYHALFFMDIHLSDSPKGFQPPAPFEIIGLDFSGKKHERQYSKSQLKQYIVHIRKKAAGLGLDPVQVEAVYRQIVNMCMAVQELEEKGE